MVTTLSILGSAITACSDGVTLTAQQKRGRQLYQGLCNRCHQLIDPKKFSDDVWIAAATRYGSRLKLTRDEISQIADYLTRANDTESKD